MSSYDSSSVAPNNSSLTQGWDSLESASAMLTPLEAIMGFLLVVGPALEGVQPASFSSGIEAGAALAGIVRSSLLEADDEELARIVEADPGSLGSLSIGAPGGGALMNAVALTPGPRILKAPGAISWGTTETIAAVHAVVDVVHELYPDTPPIFVGDISHPKGGQLKRHESHQAGRDVDFGFFYKGRTGPWYAPGTAANLDLPRNWALVRALLTCTDVETILLDTRIQRLLYRYALSISEDKEWLDRVFQFVKGSREAIIRHVPLHRTHYHVRFYSPVAQEIGRRVHPLLVERKIIDPPVYTIRHLVRSGQTLGHLASRYGTSVRSIMQANGLRSTLIRAGRTYRIPMRGVAPPSEPLVLPPRMLPPQTPEVLASFDWPTAETLYGVEAASLKVGR